MVTAKRRMQQKEAGKRTRKQHIEAGFVDYRRFVLPSWKQKIDLYIAQIKEDYYDQKGSITMTPNFAAELLMNNSLKRPIKFERVVEFTTIINNNMWDHTSIVLITQDNTIMDGIHRLNAIVESNKAVMLNIYKCAE